MAYKAKAALCMLLFSVCAGSVLAEEEVRMTLYGGRSYYDGANRKAVISLNTGAPTWFGSVEMIDRTLYNWPETNAKIIGRAIYTSTKATSNTDTLWYTFMGIIFNNDSWFNDSTLQVAGFNPVQDCERSITGGTGKLAMARGIVRHKLIRDPGSSMFSEQHTCILQCEKGLHRGSWKF